MTGRMDLRPLERRARYARAHAQNIYVTRTEWIDLWRELQTRQLWTGIGAKIGDPIPDTPPEGTQLFGAFVEISDPFADIQADSAASYFGPPTEPVYRGPDRHAPWCRDSHDNGACVDVFLARLPDRDRANMPVSTPGPDHVLQPGEPALDLLEPHEPGILTLWWRWTRARWRHHRARRQNP